MCSHRSAKWLEVGEILFQRTYQLDDGAVRITDQDEVPVGTQRNRGIAQEFDPMLLDPIEKGLKIRYIDRNVLNARIILDMS